MSSAAPGQRKILCDYCTVRQAISERRLGGEDPRLVPVIAEERDLWMAVPPNKERTICWGVSIVTRAPMSESNA